MNNSDHDNSSELKSGYDLPVYGLADGSFFSIHIPALCSIFCSFVCVVTVLIMSFRHRDYKKFFLWTKIERFIVYLAICDGGFNLSHTGDHVQYVLTQDHVRPKELCAFYGFMITVFVTAQVLMVNIVATNAFTLMYFKKNLNFGHWDYRLLIYMFGVPLVAGTVSLALDQYGPAGSFCFYDGVKGGTAYVSLATIPLVIILFVNCVLYSLTWKRIKQETTVLSQQLHNTSVAKKSRRVARTMTMFVAAFFIQWWALAFFGVWVSVDADTVPRAIIHIGTILTNIGGCLNLGIYLIMMYRSGNGQKEQDSDKKFETIHGAEGDQHYEGGGKMVIRVPRNTSEVQRSS